MLRATVIRDAPVKMELPQPVAFRQRTPFQHWEKKETGISVTIMSSSLSLHLLQINIKLGRVEMKINSSPKFPSCWFFPMSRMMGFRCAEHLKIVREFHGSQHMGYNFIFSCFQENILEDE